MSPGNTAAFVAACAVLAVAPGVATAEKPSWSLALEGGGEYDTNVHRIEVDPDESTDTPAAPLMRLAARMRLRWRRVRSEQLSFSGLGLLKTLADDDSQEENVAAIAGNLAWQRRVRDGVSFGARAIYYDSFQYDLVSSEPSVFSDRTFSNLDGEAALTLHGEGEHRLRLHAGGRRFRYKPDDDFDWIGDHYGFRYRTSVWRGDPEEDLDAASIDIDAGYRLERRRYEGRAFTNNCPVGSEPEPMCTVPTAIGREDLRHIVAAEVVYTGDRIYSGRYEVHVADSNSFGQSLVRQRLELSITTELFAELFLTARATVLVNLFLDPLLLARDVQSQTFTTIDDENRNSLSLLLSRDIGAHWAVEGRYAFFTNEFATEELRFRRHTVYLGAVYRYQR